jgi:hypothetical protein
MKGKTKPKLKQDCVYETQMPRAMQIQTVAIIAKLQGQGLEVKNKGSNIKV